MSLETEEYYSRYEELQRLLERAYVDIYFLQEIEKYNQSIQTSGKTLITYSHNALGHICDLLKADLGLTVWKLYSDNNQKANTIKRLASYIHQNFIDCIDVDNMHKMSISKNLREAENRLRTLRKDFLAHNDAQKQHTMVKVSEMSAIVEELRIMLNSLCYPEIDSRATKITDQQLMLIIFDVSLGFGMMIHRSTFSPSEH